MLVGESPIWGFYEEINFRSGYYIEYLIELSVKLGILKKMKAIGCEAYQVTNEYNTYNKLDNKEKVKFILKHSLDIANNKLNDAPYLNVMLNKNKNENIALKLLDNDIGNIQCHNEEEEMFLDEYQYMNLDGNYMNGSEFWEDEISENISKDTSKAIKNVIKDKDKYLNMYDRYLDDIF